MENFSCWNVCSAEVIGFLIDKNPRAIAAENSVGETHLDCLLDTFWGRYYDVSDADRLDLVKLRVEKYSQALSKKDYREATSSADDEGEMQKSRKCLMRLDDDA